MSTSPQTPLDYRPPAPAPARSGWGAVGLVFLGLLLGLAAGIAISVSIGLVFPTTSRAQAGHQANYVFLGGLAIAACSVPAGICRRWLLAGLLAGAGATTAFFGFAIGMMSSITC